MRRQHGIVNAEEWVDGRERLRLECIESGTRDALLAECLRQRLLTHQRSAADADEVRGRSHESELAVAEHAPHLGCRRTVQADNIALAQERAQSDGLGAVVAAALRGADAASRREFASRIWVTKRTSSCAISPKPISPSVLRWISCPNSSRAGKPSGVRPDSGADGPILRDELLGEKDHVDQLGCGDALLFRTFRVEYQTAAAVQTSRPQLSVPTPRLANATRRGAPFRNVSTVTGPPSTASHPVLSSSSSDERDRLRNAIPTPSPCLVDRHMDDGGLPCGGRDAGRVDDLHRKSSPPYPTCSEQSPKARTRGFRMSCTKHAGRRSSLLVDVDVDVDADVEDATRRDDAAYTNQSVYTATMLHNEVHIWSVAKTVAGSGRH